MATDHEQKQREAEINTRMINDIHALTGIPVANINCKLSWIIQLYTQFDGVRIEILHGEYVITVTGVLATPERTIALAELMLQAAKIVTELLEVE